ncbi:MAG: murein L,D-transpeptidase, partial [Gammaproteobacteria bacterium]|nr:murein L,D-transpeptidase [Gammaproteobacteria bacterium]
ARVDDLIDRARPGFPAYVHFKRELARYREIRDRGGWAPVPAGPTLRSGVRDARVV